MIKVKMKDGKVKIKAKGIKSFVIKEIAFAAAGCISEMCSSPEDFVITRDKVIKELSKFNLSADGKSFELKE